LSGRAVQKIFSTEEGQVKRINYLLGAAIGLALTGTAAQADVKDPLPDSLSLGGVTLYGTVDVGFAYQSNGVPLNSQLPGGLEYQAFTTTRNFNGSVTTVAESGLEQSKIGVRVSQPIVNDLSLVARAETGFNPLSGQLTDACASLESNSGKTYGNQNANADSSRCGQAFNAQLFGGLSSTSAGTLTFGRHNALQLDALAQYDPQALSYAFSFLGYSGFNGGSGSTQAARWDNSVKYMFQSDPVHLALMYSSGGQDTGILNNAYGADIGVSMNGFSVDVTYQNEKGAVNLRSSFDNGANPVPSPGLAAYISDDTSYNLMAKYVFDVNPGSKDKVTLYAGYSHIEKAHGDYVTGSSEGGYPLSVGININNSAEYNMEWIGARYAMGSGLNLIAAFYHANQNSWTIGKGTTGTDNIGCSDAGLLCAGDFTEASFVVDYMFNKHYDIYGGINYSTVTDGLANGFMGTTSDGTTGSESQTTVMWGVRVRF
jgi:predicted porin